MKKRMAVIILIILCCTTACGKDTVVTTVASESNATDVDTKGGLEAKEVNRVIIAEALGIEENSRNIRFILSSLQAIEAGQIQSAAEEEVDGESMLNLVAQDGTNYQLYLSKEGNVEAIKNLDTDEWLVQSTR